MGGRRRARVVGLVLVGAVAMAVTAGCAGGDDTDDAAGGPDASTAGATSSTRAGASNPQPEGISFAALWAARDERVGVRVTVAGRSLFRLDCASPTDGVPPCVATGFLTDPATDDLPLYEQRPAFALHHGGRAVSCRTQTLSGDFSCMGFRHDEQIHITGSLRHLVLGGRETDDLVFEADTEEQR